jgi:hypothetical protein
MSPTPWHYNDAGQPSGPHSTEHLRTLLANGTITPATLVWNPTFPAWRPAGQCPELLPVATAAAVYPTPPLAALPPPPTAPQTAVQYATPSTQSQHGSAVIALVVSLLALVVPCGGTLLGIIAIVIAANAISGMSKSGNHDGRAIAVSALAVAILASVSHGVLLAFGLPYRFGFHF